MALSPAAHAIGRRLLFGVGAGAYDALTGQPLWRAQIERLLERVPDRDRPLEVLDLGTGPGVSAFALAESLPAGSEVTGVDLSARMISRARAHHVRRFAHLDRLRFLEADAARLPCDARAFDLVTGHSFLYLLSDPVVVLEEVRRVLRPGGAAAFMEPAAGGSLVEALRSTPGLAQVLRTDPRGAVRFGTSMALWRVVSAAHGRMSRDRVATLFAAAGLPRVSVFPTLGGLGLHCVVRAPPQPA